MGSPSEAGPLIWGHLILLLGGLVWALACAVMLAMKWKVPPVVATAPLLAHGGLVLGVAMWASSRPPVGADDPAARAVSVAGALSTMLGNATASVAVVPVAALLMLGGLFAGARGRRRFGAPALAALLGFGAAAMPLVALVLVGADMPLAAGRFLLYMVATVAVAGALVGAHPDDNSREGGLIATAGFAALVASCELLVQSSQWAAGLSVLTTIFASDKVPALAALTLEIGAVATLSRVSIGLAAATALVALLRPAADLTDEEMLSGNVSPSGMRWLGGALALLVPLVWAAALLAADPSEILSGLLAVDAH